ncbi:hypothetical protein RJ641_022631 [Dillenia turbinata]|uniref:RING-type E3 ubiquitin transferase n=1 Tax=Dillenia turbinata TaxID=194707 RepID=A0AAN8UCT0_9MAGN
MLMRGQTEPEKQQSPQNPKQQSPKQPTNVVGDGRSTESILSPGFRSMAEMAGWDEESLLFASLIVEDTPDRVSNQKRPTDLQFKTPTTYSRRKRRAPRRSPIAIPVPVLDLDEEPTVKGEDEKKSEPKIEDKKVKDEGSSKGSSYSCSNTVLPCIDKLREELSCAKCLLSAADKCGKRCPKCRQHMSNGRSCTVNTVLWNTIQLLFPQETEARKAAAVASNSQERETKNKSPIRNNHSNDNLHSHNRFLRESDTGEGSSYMQGELRRLRNGSLRNRSTRVSRPSSRDVSERRRKGMAEQDEDAALALRLQREEFMEAFGGTDEPERFHSAGANLRAMASRAMTLGLRGRRYIL